MKKLIISTQERIKEIDQTLIHNVYKLSDGYEISNYYLDEPSKEQTMLFLPTEAMHLIAKKIIHNILRRQIKHDVVRVRNNKKI